LRFTDIKDELQINNKNKESENLVFSRFYDASAFIRKLTVLQANSIFVGAFPFGAAAGTGGFVFVTPDFQFATADVAVDVGGFRL
jgi:hypothetical protein